jgi:hypothetical protein
MKNFKLREKPPALHRDYQGLPRIKFIPFPFFQRQVCIGFLDPHPDSNVMNVKLNHGSRRRSREWEVDD